MYTAKELQDRYKMNSKQAFLKYVREHLDIINKDGAHAVKNASNGWEFDEVAVKLLDHFRGISKINVVQEVESDRIRQLNEQIANLQIMINALQQKVIQANEETKTALKESNQLLKERQPLMLAAAELKKSKERIEEQDKMIEALKAAMNDWKDKQVQIDASMDEERKRERTELAKARTDIAQLREENQSLRTRSFWKRLLNR